MTLKDKFFRTILDAYPAVMSNLQPDGSMVYPDTGYTIYQQYSGYYFAFLYKYNHPDNPYLSNPEMLTLSTRCWKHFSTQVNDQGLIRIITMNQDFNMYWPEEWGFYNWLLSYELIGGDLPPADRDFWLEKLHLIFPQMVESVRKESEDEKFEGTLATNQIRNHFLWTVLAVYRYGQIFGKQDAMDYADSLMARALGAQLPIGTWYENYGLVIDYADITLCAMSLYGIYAKNDRAIAAVDKGLKYITSLKNPDFTKVLGIDERNRSNKGIAAQTAPSYANSAAGVDYLSRWINVMARDKQLHKNVHGLVTVCEMLSLLPDDVPYNENPPAPPPLNTSYPAQDLFVREQGPWILSFCGMKHNAYESRWNLERQSLVGVYVKGIGPLWGGVHSIGQPEFSTFSVTRGGKVHYMHDKCTIGESSVALEYGGRTCTIEALNITDSELTLRFQVKNPGDTERVYLNLPFYNLRGTEVSFDGRKVALDKSNCWQHINADAPVLIHGVRLTASEPTEFKYPILPYNSYKIKQERNLSEVYGILSAELDYKNPSVTVTIKLK